MTELIPPMLPLLAIVLGVLLFVTEAFRIPHVAAVHVRLRVMNGYNALRHSEEAVTTAA
jgi:hypothetical protein